MKWNTPRFELTRGEIAFLVFFIFWVIVSTVATIWGQSNVQ